MTNMKFNNVAAQMLFADQQVAPQQAPAQGAQQAQAPQAGTYSGSYGDTVVVSTDANGNRYNAEGKRVVKGKNGQDYVATEFWCNPCIPQKVTTVNEQGEAVEEVKFTKLPTGIALDTMKEREYVTGPNAASLNAVILAENKFRAQLLALAESLEPGTSMVINMPFEIRRVGTPAVAVPEDDVLSKGVESFFANVQRLA